MTFTEMLQPIRDVLHAHGWALLMSDSQVEKRPRGAHTSEWHFGTIWISKDGSGMPHVHFRRGARSIESVVQQLLVDATAWTATSDIGREIITLQRESQRLSEEANKIHEAEGVLEERIRKLRVQDFIEHIREYLGDIKWACARVSSGFVRLQAVEMSDGAEMRLSKRLGFAHHGGENLGDDISIRTDDGEVTLTATSLSSMLDFLRRHDFINNVCWDKLDEDITRCRDERDAAAAQLVELEALKATI